MIILEAPFGLLKTWAVFSQASQRLLSDLLLTRLRVLSGKYRFH